MSENSQEIVWRLARNFNTGEAWGEPEKINPLLLWLLQSIRDRLPRGSAIKIHVGFKTAGHSKSSWHYKGMAVDFHVIGLSVLEAEEIIMKFLTETGLIEYVGIGIYPDWNNPGFHLDVRGTRAAWSRIGADYLAYLTGVNYIKNGYKTA